MLNDEERSALNIAASAYRLAAAFHTVDATETEAMFAAGIAYAQKQQAAMIAQGMRWRKQLSRLPFRIWRRCCAGLSTHLATQRRTSRRSPQWRWTIYGGMGWKAHHCAAPAHERTGNE